jgi:hypothetical protein
MTVVGRPGRRLGLSGRLHLDSIWSASGLCRYSREVPKAIVLIGRDERI